MELLLLLTPTIDIFHESTSRSVVLLEYYSNLSTITNFYLLQSPAFCLFIVKTGTVSWLCRQRFKITFDFDIYTRRELFSREIWTLFKCMRWTKRRCKKRSKICNFLLTPRKNQIQENNLSSSAISQCLSVFASSKTCFIVKYCDCIKLSAPLVLILLFVREITRVKWD